MKLQGNKVIECGTHKSKREEKRNKESTLQTRVRK